MRMLPLALLLVLTFLMGLVSQLPLRFIQAELGLALPSALGVPDPGATLWSGDTQLPFAEDNAVRLNWRLASFGFEPLGVQWAVSIAADGVAGEGMLTLNPITQTAALTLPEASVEMGRLPPAWRGPLYGPLGQLHVAGMALAGDWALENVRDVSGSLAWMDARFELIREHSLGTVRGTLSPAPGNGARAQLQNEGGAVSMDADLVWQPGAASALDLTIRVPDNAPPDIEKLLARVARRQGGAWRIQRSFR